jgi:DNA-binding MarR family transcriptional regulator
MTSGQLSVLEDLRRYGPQTPGELAAVMNPARAGWMGHQTVTANLHRLRRRGYVRRDDGGIWHLLGAAAKVLDA